MKKLQRRSGISARSVPEVGYELMGEVLRSGVDFDTLVNAALLYVLTMGEWERGEAIRTGRFCLESILAENDEEMADVQARYPAPAPPTLSRGEDDDPPDDWDNHPNL